MKKSIVIIGIIVLVALLIGSLLFLGSKVYVQHKFKSDHEYVEKVMLQKDSENRGYSDLIKERIEKRFKNSETREVLFKHAKTFRKVVKSKTQSEFTEASKELMISLGCAYYILDRNKETEKLYAITEDYAADNSEMADYYEYLDTIRFVQASWDIADFFNKDENRVDTEEDFNRLCKK